MIKKQGIYQIRNIINFKMYIGSSVRIKCRQVEHFNKLATNRHENSRLQNAWNKYGATSFEFSVIEFVEDKTNLIEREQHWIDFYDASNRNIGYNLLPKAGSPLGYKHTEESKAKMRESRKGHIVSEETCRRISLANKGRKQTKEHTENHARAVRGKIPSKEARVKMSLSSKGRKRSPEAIAKTVAFHLGAKRSEESRQRMRKPHKIMSEETKQKMKAKRAAISEEDKQKAKINRMKMEIAKELKDTYIFKFIQVLRQVVRE